MLFLHSLFLFVFFSFFPVVTWNHNQHHWNRTDSPLLWQPNQFSYKANCTLLTATWALGNSEWPHIQLLPVIRNGSLYNRSVNVWTCGRTWVEWERRTAMHVKGQENNKRWRLIHWGKVLFSSGLCPLQSVYRVDMGRLFVNIEQTCVNTEKY